MLVKKAKHSDTYLKILAKFVFERMEILVSVLTIRSLLRRS